MRIGLILLILFSHLLLFPLAKNHLLFSNDDKFSIRVNRGDSVSSIAQSHNVSVADVRQWNNMSETDKLHRGQKLTLYRHRKPKAVLEPGQVISMHRPVSNWQVIKGYIPYGDSKNLGLLCKVQGNTGVNPANSGRIVKISHLRGYGKYILIDHGNGWHSMYSNLDDVKVKSGQYVNLSETIGNAKDNKLFFLLAYNGKPVNPTGYFRTTERN